MKQVNVVMNTIAGLQRTRPSRPDGGGNEHGRSCCQGFSCGDEESAVADFARTLGSA